MKRTTGILSRARNDPEVMVPRVRQQRLESRSEWFGAPPWWPPGHDPQLHCSGLSPEAQVGLARCVKMVWRPAVVADGPRIRNFIPLDYGQSAWSFGSPMTRVR